MGDFFSLEAPFTTRYTVYWLPDQARNVPGQTVDQKWIVERKNDGAFKEYGTKKEAVKNAKERAKENKPSVLWVYKKGGDLQDKHQYHAEHFYGDQLI